MQATHDSKWRWPAGARLTSIWPGAQAMHTSGEDATSVTRQRLLRTRRALRLLLGGTEALSAAASDQLARCLRPLLAAGAGPPPLHVLFDVPPRLDWAQVRCGVS